MWTHQVEPIYEVEGRHSPTMESTRTQEVLLRDISALIFLPSFFTPDVYAIQFFYVFWSKALLLMCPIGGGWQSCSVNNFTTGLNTGHIQPCSKEYGSTREMNDWQCTVENVGYKFPLQCRWVASNLLSSMPKHICTATSSASTIISYLED